MRIKKKSKKLSIVLLALIMIFSSLAYTFANENQQLVDISPWAIEEVNMASLYGLTHQSLLNEFKASITNEQLSFLGANLFARLTNISDQGDIAEYHKKMIGNVWKESYEPKAAATRGNVAKVLLDAIKASSPELTITELNASRYLSNNKIIMGRGNNDLDLEAYCNRQELFALLKRTYEFVIHETNRASKGYFYKVSGGKSEVYVLGSIHIADISLYPLHRKIEEAFSKADYIVVEADVSNIQAAVAYMQQKALYFDGTTIDKVLTEETYKLYKEKVEGLGLDPNMYNILKPWYAAMLIQNLSLSEAQYSGGFGVDLYFLSRAKGKSILELEGVKFQVDLFDNLSIEMQEMFLKDVLASTQKNEEEKNISIEIMGNMLKAWKEGNVEELEKLIALTNEAEEVSEFNEMFWVERNKNMTVKIDSYLKDDSGKTYFVIVGAGHLVGEAGIIDDLVKLGYKLERVTK